MAPEFIEERIFTNKSDIYSLGIVFWEIIHRDTIPYKNTNTMNFMFGDKVEVSDSIIIEKTCY